MMTKVLVRSLTFGLPTACMTGIALITAIAASATSAAAATDPDALTVAWRNKPPYHYFENGVEKGFLLDRAKQVFALAEVPAHFVEVPAKRIWASLAGGVKNYCSIGWYLLPEREQIAQFSVIFHTDPPHTLLIAPEAVARVRAHHTLASLLADHSLSLGVVDGVSYGPLLDAMIRTSQNDVERKTIEVNIMTRSVAANRVSFMFIDRDDWKYLRDTEESLRRTVQLDFPDMPPGLNRYIVCSKDVPAATMDKLNKAIESIDRMSKHMSKRAVK